MAVWYADAMHGQYVTWCTCLPPNFHLYLIILLGDRGNGVQEIYLFGLELKSPQYKLEFNAFVYISVYVTICLMFLSADRNE